MKKISMRIQHLLGNQVFNSLGHAALGDLERSLDFFLDSLPLLLDRRAESFGAAVKIARQVWAVGKAAGILGNELIKRHLELDLLQAVVAIWRKKPVSSERITCLLRRLVR